MKFKIISILLIVVTICGLFFFFYFKPHRLKPVAKFPQWLKCGDTRTNQTSGIAFIKQIGTKKIFLLADDSGDIHRITYENDKLISIKKIVLLGCDSLLQANALKLDFEEICFDRFSGSVYVTFEGDGKRFKENGGIYKLNFAGSNIDSDTILGLTKINVTPSDKFFQYVQTNIGFEGLTVDDKFMYAGFEGFSDNDMFFKDSTLIYVINKSDFSIFKTINTYNYKIGTISGLYSDKPKSLWVLDRNDKALHHVVLNDNLEIEVHTKYNIPISIPKYRRYTYAAALESVTMEPDGSIYLVDDPFTNYYVPAQSVLNKFDEQTRKNFREFVPIIMKFTVN